MKRPKVKMPRRKPKLKGLPAPKRNLPVSKRPPLPASTKKLRTSVKVAGGAAAAGAAGAGAYKVRKRRQAKKAARGVK